MYVMHVQKYLLFSQVSEQLDAVCVIELDQEPKSKPSPSAAESSQVSLHTSMWTSCSCRSRFGVVIAKDV